jgi:acyl carrier protein
MASLRDDIYRRLKPILADSLGAEEDEINWDTNVYDDLNADELEFHGDVIPTIEETFGVTIEDEVLPELTTVRELVDYLAENA